MADALIPDARISTDVEIRIAALEARIATLEQHMSLVAVIADDASTTATCLAESALSRAKQQLSSDLDEALHQTEALHAQVFSLTSQ